MDEGDLVSISGAHDSSALTLLSRVLVNGANRVFKDGLDRGYLPREEETQSLRGRINFSASLSRLLLEQGKVCVNIDELSHNILHNQILKTTLVNLSKSEALDNKILSDLAKTIRNFGDVDVVRLNSSIFRRVQLHQNNSFYSFLMSICELLHLNLLPDQEQGSYKFRDFTRDERKMAKVFQDFAFNLFKLEQFTFKVYSERLQWDEFMDIPGSEMLPYMYTDVTLMSKNRKIILDTKYYQEAFQENWGVKKIKSDHLYQLNAYLDSSVSPEGGGKVEGILLYPATAEEFTIKRTIRGHHITVAAVDLRQEPDKIKNRMLSLIEN